jgi:hypothetical protein
MIKNKYKSISILPKRVMKEPVTVPVNPLANPKGIKKKCEICDKPA